MLTLAISSGLGFGTVSPLLSAEWTGSNGSRLFKDDLSTKAVPGQEGDDDQEEHVDSDAHESRKDWMVVHEVPGKADAMDIN